MHTHTTGHVVMSTCWKMAFGLSFLLAATLAMNNWLPAAVWKSVRTFLGLG